MVAHPPKRLELKLSFIVATTAHDPQKRKINSLTARQTLAAAANRKQTEAYPV